jgi:hypothetical protein
METRPSHGHFAETEGKKKRSTRTSKTDLADKGPPKTGNAA